MGVPGLHTFLEGYGSRTDFTSSGESVSLVIDGPALAYWLWNDSGCYEGSLRKYVKALTRFIHILQNVAHFEMYVV